MIQLSRDKQKGILITVGIIVITAVASVKIILQPQQAQVVELRAEINQEKERNSLIKQVIAIENSIKNSQEKLAPQGESSWLEKKIRQLAGGLDIEVLRIKAKDSAQEIPGLMPLALEVKLKADYHKISKLVSQLEKAPEFIEINRLKIASISSQAWDKLAQAKEELAVSSNARRARTPNQQAVAVDTANESADLETVINEGREVEAVIEVNTYYVQ